MLWFNDTSTLVGHFVSSPREREIRDRRDSRRDEREGQGSQRNRTDWVEYYVQCLWCDISVKQHSKNEHPDTVAICLKDC